MKNKLKIIMACILLGIVSIAINLLPEKKPNYTADNYSSIEEKKDDDKIYFVDGTVMTKDELNNCEPEDDKESKKTDGITLTSGNYVIGKDIEPGIYDIIAVDEDGLVRTNDYKINNLFGIDESKRDLGYLKDFKNAKLEEGQTLEVDGVTIKLVSKK